MITQTGIKPGNAIILKHFINADDFICSRMKVTEKKKGGGGSFCSFEDVLKIQIAAGN